MEFTNVFETHLTVLLNHQNGLERLREWAESNNFKFLHIMLDRGTTVSQPMLTRRGKGGFSDELAMAKRVTETLKSDGFEVTRIKIETSPLNYHPQQSGTEIPTAYNTYFENHIKLLINPAVDILNLSQIAEQHSAHLSRNALRVRSDGYQERFVTQRTPTLCRAKQCARAASDTCVRNLSIRVFSSRS